MNYQDFIKPELLILIPVLYFVGTAIKTSKYKDEIIPLTLGLSGVLLSVVYLLATEQIEGVQGVFTALWTGLTQGILCAAAAVYGNQIIKQAEKDRAESQKKEDNNDGTV